MASERPYVILNAAMSLDGKIATRTGESKLSSEKDLRRVHRLRSEVDGIMVGMGTILVDDPKLTVKKSRGRNPSRIIVDSLARTPKTAYVVKTAKDIQTIIAVTERAPQRRVQSLQQAGVLVLHSGRSGLVSLPRLMRQLRRLGIRRLLLEGGGTLNWSMLDSRLVDEVSVAISPTIIGGVDAVSLVEGRGAGMIDSAVKLRFVIARRYGSSLVVKYDVLR